ncbi:hypothetical protein FMN63_22160 [Stappia sp. BW2]|uniref:hypothetical protein n=1 Tax=Stappia sp. BW2 TaxID=2592622 RepID=UPI0011DE613E|nr:hypothetical protein [Stappia sp. BW2]TYC65136.1 hypothetical protein FMN63_22160 [Stappia sp. BW2]
MSQSRIRNKLRTKLLSNEKRCIYCASLPETIEHFPPVSLFDRRDRPSGLEFAACEACNHGTKAAEALAVFVSRIDKDERTAGFWGSQAGQNAIFTLEREAPGLRSQILQNPSISNYLAPSGEVEQQIEIRLSSEKAKNLLDAFSAKLGMALYREHIGEPLPLNGIVQTIWYTNAGLGRDLYEKLLRTFPIFATLKQGKKSYPNQFGYRYNTDGSRILAALVSFHGNFHVFFVASGEPETFELPYAFIGASETTGNVMHPGELLSRLT